MTWVLERLLVQQLIVQPAAEAFEGVLLRRAPTPSPPDTKRIDGAKTPSREGEIERPCCSVREDFFLARNFDLDGPRRCGHLPEPEDGGGECDDGEVVSGGFLEAGGDAPELFELGEAALDQVALAVELAVEGVVAGALWRGWDDSGCVHAGHDIAEMRRVIGAVGQHDLRRQAGDERGGLWHVATVTGGEAEGDGVAEPSHGHVDRAAQAAA